jgi:hypothetical protein
MEQTFIEKIEKIDKIEKNTLHKMILLYNALEEGWTIKRKNDTYVFSKNHERKKEILSDSYLLKFMKTNLDLSKILEN